MNQISLNHREIKALIDFIDKHVSKEDTDHSITLHFDSSSGIGSNINVSTHAIVNDDEVLITKIISDESNW